MIKSFGTPHEKVNPPYAPYMWLDMTTGEIYVCADNTRDANIWVGQSDSSVLGPIPTAGLIYKQGVFSGGVAPDLSGNGNDFAITGGSASTYLGMPGVYLDSNGNTVGAGNVTLTDFSVSFWYKANTDQTLYRWFSIGTWNISGSFILYNDTGSSGIVGGCALPSDNNQISVGVVNPFRNTALDHVVYTRSGSATSIYLNGALKNSTNGIISGTQTVGGVMTIGAAASSAKGWLAGLRVYNVGLTADEVLSLYEEPVKMW